MGKQDRRPYTHKALNTPSHSGILPPDMNDPMMSLRSVLVPTPMVDHGSNSVDYSSVVKSTGLQIEVNGSISLSIRHFG